MWDRAVKRTIVRRKRRGERPRRPASRAAAAAAPQREGAPPPSALRRATAQTLPAGKMASTLPERINFAQEEEKILALWKKLDAFHRSLELTKDKPEVRPARARRRRRRHQTRSPPPPPPPPAHGLIPAALAPPSPCSTPSTMARPSRRGCPTTGTSLPVRSGGEGGPRGGAGMPGPLSACAHQCGG